MNVFVTPVSAAENTAASCTFGDRPLNVDPRHSIAPDQCPLKIRPKRARSYSQSAAIAHSGVY